MVVDWLERIASNVRRAVEDGYYADFAALTAPPAERAPSLAKAVTRDAPWAFLAEIKPAAPSRDDLAAGPTVARARLDIYRRYGVTGVSVLTERDTFQGSLDVLRDAATEDPLHPVPVLMKDFVLHDDQLAAAEAAGASAVLFLHHLFERRQTQWSLEAGIKAAHGRGLEVLLEVDNGPALEAALATKADLVGVNNRDLRTLEMSPDRTPDLLRHRLAMLQGRPVLALSGTEHRADVAAMQRGGASGVLVGSALMAAERPRDLLRALRDVVHIKLCGTGHPDDGDAVLDALVDADAVGVVLSAPGAVRQRTSADARRVFEHLPADVERFVVTTETDPAAVEELVESTGATGVQLHSDDAYDTLPALRARLGAAIRLITLARLPPAGEATTTSADEVVATVRRLAPHSDRVLLDTARAAGATGGSGRSADLATAARVVRTLPNVPLVLAGGLRPDTVADAILQVRPWGVDVSSGIERVRGRKDPAAMHQFCHAARRVRNVHDIQAISSLRVVKNE